MDMVQNKRLGAVYIPLHDSAERLLLEYIDTFGETLVLQAKLLAYERGDDLVLSTHVSDALDILQRERQRNWRREFVIVVGSSFLGAGGQGFFTELGNQPARPLFIAFWAIMAFVSIIAVFVSFMVGKR